MEASLGLIARGTELVHLLSPGMVGRRCRFVTAILEVNPQAGQFLAIGDVLALETKTTHLEATELIRRYLLHVLPDRLHRIRYYGLFANRFRAANLERCRVLLSVPAPDPSEEGGGDGEPETWQESLEQLTGIDPTRCPVCKTGRLVCLERLPPQLARATPPSRFPAENRLIAI